MRTPHLDRLAGQGIRFDHHYVQNPVCMPSRVSMLTGQYPSTLGITHMGVPVPRDIMTLPRMLKNQGYTSANFGKLHFLPHGNRDHRQIHPDYGFDQLEISDEPGSYDDAYRAYIHQRMPDQLDHIGQVTDPPLAQTWRKIMKLSDGIRRREDWDPWAPRAFPGRSEATHTAFVAQRTIEYLETRTRSSQPFFCIAGFYNPHSPLVAPQEFPDLYPTQSLTAPSFPAHYEDRRVAEGFTDQTLIAAKRGYYAMVSELDHHIGRVLDALDRLGLAENTLVIYTSDHGEFLGEFCRWGKDYPGPDCVSRVPLLVRHPRNAQGAAAAVQQGMVEAVDLAPSMLQLSGAVAPPHLQGRSWADAVCDRPWAGRQDVLMEHAGWKSLRSATHRYILHQDGSESLFDLTRPLGEYDDVAKDADAREALAEHRRRLANRWLEMERPLPRTWRY